jgi:short-subunit dehydrogenase
MSAEKRKLALVTGASGGIGADLARELAGDGHDLILVARSTAALEGLAAELRSRHGVEVRVLTADLARPGAASDLFARIGAGEVDVLVNNAGFGDHGPFHAADPARIDGMIALNVAALTSLTRLLLPGMVARKRGRLLNVASTAAFQPGPMMAVYCASKAYVLSFSLALGDELRGSGVTVTALCPGATATGFMRAAGVEKIALFNMPGMAAMSSIVVARQGYAALKAGKRVIVTGFNNRVGALMGRLLPYGLVLSVSRRLLAAGR